MRSCEHCSYIGKRKYSITDYEYICIHDPLEKTFTDPSRAETCKHYKKMKKGCKLLI